jgi:hypothetical protein
MVYLASILISFILFFADVSLLPHFLPWLTVPFLFLPFISILSLKDRTIFPIILAGVMGLATDAVSGSPVPVFSIAYMAVVIISKVFMGRFLSYGEIRANLINVSVGLTIIYGVNLAIQINTVSGYLWVLAVLANIGATFLTLIAYLWFGHDFFLWIEKETEERYR